MCSYDRAEFGWSDAAAAALDLLATEHDLAAMLARSDQRRHYLLMRHSKGGFIVRACFALGGEIDFSLLPARQHDERAAFWAGLAHWAAMRGELAVAPLVFEQSQQLGPIGPIPTIVITAGANTLPGWRVLQRLTVSSPWEYLPPAAKVRVDPPIAWVAPLMFSSVSSKNMNASNGTPSTTPTRSNAGRSGLRSPIADDTHNRSKVCPSQA